MQLRHLALAPALILLLAACSGGGSSTPISTARPTSPPAQATSSPVAPTDVAPTDVAPTDVAPTSGLATPGARTIAVSLTDALRIEPAEMSVTAGEPVTFVVTNTGAIEHEFYLGDEAQQAEHETEMAEMGGMAHDEPNGIGLEPGETKELTFTFASAGEWIAGCHVPGHYPAGMKATIDVAD